MRLADFISSHVEPILAEWVTFAATRGPVGEAMDLVALRDHAAEMLAAIVVDLRTPQTAAEQAAKSTGNALPPAATAPETAASVHGAGRAESGFTLGEMVSEYRALRASVLRLWTKANGGLSGADLDDLIRFNEAIDQALAESATRYTQDLDQSKEMFLAILGHDLRTPLGAVLTSSQFMLDRGGLTEPDRTLTARVLRSATRMNHMVGDLLDLTRSRLGAGVPVVRGDTDLAEVARHVVEEVAAAHPERVLKLDTAGDLRGAWDAARVSQLLTNLLANAVQHGAADTPVRVTARGRRRTSCSRCTTAARQSRCRTCPACSTRSSASGPAAPRRGTRGTSAWGSTLRSGSPPLMGAPSTSPRPLRRAPRSPCACREARDHSAVSRTAARREPPLGPEALTRWSRRGECATRTGAGGVPTRSYLGADPAPMRW